MPRIGRSVLVGLFLAYSVLAISAQDAVITPGDNLVADGIPKIPTAIAEKTARYTQFRTAALRSWHPTRPEMLITTRFGESDQVHLVRQPMGDRSQLTFFPDRVLNATFNPVTGDYFVFQKDANGGEWFQLYRYDMATANVTLLTDGKARNDDMHFNHQGTRIAYTSTRRNNKDDDIWVMDPMDRATDRMLMQADSGGWFPADWSHDGKSLVVIE